MATNTTTQKILMTPIKPALIMGMAQKLPVLIRIQAPDATDTPSKERNPYHLSLVIDRSGSMSGEPLREAVRCARHIIDRLAPTDVASLVVFDDNVKTLAPAKPVGDRKMLHVALAHIHSGGSTNLHGGWQTGMKEILEDAPQAAMARVILLSDGNANVGKTIDTEEIAALCAEAAKKGVTTSTYGLGRNFNEDLMIEMGRQGCGNHYYGETAADLFEPFAEEFDFISNLYARHVRLSLNVPEGIRLNLLNDYLVEQQNGITIVQLPDIPLGAEAWVIAELEIPSNLALDSSHTLLQASVTASTLEGLAIDMENATLKLDAVSTQIWDALLPDELVATRLAELEASRFLDQARIAAERGDWQTIQRMMTEGQARFAAHPWVMEILKGIDKIAEDRDMVHFLKETKYSSRKMSSRVSGKDEVLSLAFEAQTPAYLRRKSQQGKTQFESK